MSRQRQCSRGVGRKLQGAGWGRELSQAFLPGHLGSHLSLGTPVSVSKQGQKAEFQGLHLEVTPVTSMGDCTPVSVREY